MVWKLKPITPLKLLTRDEKYRLGVCSPVRDHPFFQRINWDDVINKRLVPPIKPQVTVTTFKDSNGNKLITCVRDMTIIATLRS